MYKFLPDKFNREETNILYLFIIILCQIEKKNWK